MRSLSKRRFGWLCLAVAGVITGLTPRAHAQDWIRQFGTSAHDVAWALATDGAEGVMVAGFTHGSLGRPNRGSADAFLARYDSAGDRLWIRQFGRGEYDRAYALAPDGAGGVRAAGNTRGSLGGPNAGSSDAFLARYDSAGDRLWIRQFGTSSADVAHALASDGKGDVMVAGSTRGDLGGPNAGDWDVFLARFSVCDPCDMNCDGTVDALDIEFFIDILFNGATPCDPCTGDTNGDGNIDAEDIEGFINCLFP